MGPGIKDGMDCVVCHECGYSAGLGTAAEYGRCPECNIPLVLAVELKSLSPAELKARLAERAAEPRGPSAIPGTAPAQGLA
jgi:hypothetical protein